MDNIKKIISISISKVTPPIPADELQTYGDYVVKSIEGGFAIIRYLDTDKDVVIPDEINSEPVVSLDSGIYKTVPYNEFLFLATMKP